MRYAIDVGLSETAYQDHIPAPRTTREKELATIAGPIEKEYVVRFEISQLSGGTTLEWLAPDVHNTVAPREVRHCSPVRAPTDKSWHLY